MRAIFKFVLTSFCRFEYGYQGGTSKKIYLIFKFELTLSAIFNMATGAVFLN